MKGSLKNKKEPNKTSLQGPFVISDNLIFT